LILYYSSIPSTIQAIETFKTALEYDPSPYQIWFNLAMAQISMKNYEDAKKSLHRALQIKPVIPAAQHMLKALSKDVAENLQYSDRAYIKDLYDSYARTYDEHNKKLRYATPRVIREEMAAIYKASNRFEGVVLGEHTDVEGHACVPANVPSSEGGCSSHAHVMAPGPLDVLDLGCGTGLAGGWLKDYSKNLIGSSIFHDVMLFKVMLFT
jgi:predicted TPR repeat methyltransferase